MRKILEVLTDSGIRATFTKEKSGKIWAVLLRCVTVLGGFAILAWLLVNLSLVKLAVLAGMVLFGYVFYEL